MSKYETPLTHKLWQEIGGTLVEEFQAVKGNRNQGRRLLDGVIILGEEKKIASKSDIVIENKDIVIIQTKTGRLGMYLLGQALFSKELMKSFKPKSIRTVALCNLGDTVLEPIAKKYGIEVRTIEPQSNNV